MKNQFVVLLFGLLLLAACSNSSKDSEPMGVAADGAAAPTVAADNDTESQLSKTRAAAASAPATNEDLIVSLPSSAAAKLGLHDSTRRLIRTADIKFRTKDAVKSTYAIEDIVARHGGFITATHLSSELNREKEQNISRDSILITTFYTVNNRLQFRVPAAKLDATLRDLSPLMDFLDYRNITVKDVTLNILSNQWNSRHNEESAERLREQAEEGKYQNKTLSAEELAWQREEAAQQAKMENLSLADQIAYSTVDVHLYQRETVRREIVPNENDSRRYEPNFFFKLADAVQDGFDVLKRVVLAAVQAWWLWLILALAVFLIRKYVSPDFLRSNAAHKRNLKI
ncbi:MAG: DUF4349 domain-containing protein [Sphingobacteriales bacterium]|nr:DUF4349 domain-containing protein [Sphingobacteriales bacterium]